MAKRQAGRRGQVAAAEFKARCLELVDHVKESRVEYIVTRHGRPVARLGPVEQARPASRLDSMRGTLLKYDRPFDPMDATWSVDRDDGEQSWRGQSFVPRSCRKRSSSIERLDV